MTLLRSPIKIFTFSLVSLCCLLPLLASADETITLRTPVYTRIEGSSTEIISDDVLSTHLMPANLNYPLTLTFRGPLGGSVTKTFANEHELRTYSLTEGIIKDKNSRPPNLEILPALCPRLVLRKNSSIPTYLGQLDRLNHIPTSQLLDPDVKKGQQYKAYAEIDGQNVLLLKKIRLTNDYEDSRILDYTGPHPLTGKYQEIYEGEGGFYANFHYAILPFEERFLKLDRQELLHLAQGKLIEIDREDLTPPLRTHAFLPGPFLSSAGAVYDMCEWGDTSYQAPIQEMDYQNIALWDWDYSIKKADPILLIVWEGDEEAWMVEKKLLSPFTLTDDIVGIFEIHRKKTIKPLRLINAANDFEITVQTGNLDVLKK